MSRQTGVSVKDLTKEIDGVITNMRALGKGPMDSISNLPQLKNPLNKVRTEELRAGALINSGESSKTVFKDMLPYTTAEYHGKNLKYAMNLNRAEGQIGKVKKGPRSFYMFTAQPKHWGARGKGGKQEHGFQDSIDITSELDAAFDTIKKRSFLIKTII